MAPPQMCITDTVFLKSPNIIQHEQSVYRVFVFISGFISHSHEGSASHIYPTLVAFMNSMIVWRVNARLISQLLTPWQVGMRPDAGTISPKTRSSRMYGNILNTKLYKNKIKQKNGGIFCWPCRKKSNTWNLKAQLHDHHPMPYDGFKVKITSARLIHMGIWECVEIP